MKKKIPINGLTLLELILVLVIVSILGSMAVPKLSQGVENQKAKQALGTLKSISHAIRLYVLDKGSPPVDFNALETAGYLDSNDYTKGYDYSLDVAVGVTDPHVQAQRTNSARVIKLNLETNTYRDESVDDSANFLNPVP